MMRSASKEVPAVMEMLAVVEVVAATLAVEVVEGQQVTPLVQPVVVVQDQVGLTRI